MFILIAMVGFLSSDARLEKELMQQSHIFVIDNNATISNKDWDDFHLWTGESWVAPFKSESGNGHWQSDFKKILGAAISPDGKTILIAGAHQTLHEGKPAIFIWRDKKLATLFGYLGSPRPLIDIQDQPGMLVYFKKSFKEGLFSKMKGNKAYATFFWSGDSRHSLVMTPKVFFRLDLEAFEVSQGSMSKHRRSMLPFHQSSQTLGDDLLPPDVVYGKDQNNPIVFGQDRITQFSWKSPQNEVLLSLGKIPSRKDLFGKKVKKRKETSIYFKSGVYDGYYEVGDYVLDHSGNARLGIGKNQFLPRISEDRAYVAHSKKKELVVYDLKGESTLFKVPIPCDFLTVRFIDGHFWAVQTKASTSAWQYDSTISYRLEGEALVEVARFELEGDFIKHTQERMILSHENSVYSLDSNGNRVDLFQLPDGENLELYWTIGGKPFLDGIGI